MALSFLYLAFRALLSALVRSRPSLHVKDVEPLVMRHELENPAQAGRAAGVSGSLSIRECARSAQAHRDCSWRSRSSSV